MSQQQQWNKSEGGGEDDVQMPLGVGGDASPVEEYSEPRGPRFNSSTLTLVAAFATAIGVLYLLGLQNKPKVASADEAAHQIEIGRRIDTIIHNRNDQEKMGKLHDSAKVLMEILVKYFEGNRPIADLKSDPFAHEGPAVVTPKGETPQPALATTSEGLLRATQAFQGLRLQGVVNGSRPSAIISDSANGDLVVSVGSRSQMWDVIGIQGGAVMMRFKDTDGTATDVVLKQNAVPLSNKH